MRKFFPLLLAILVIVTSIPTVSYADDVAYKENAIDQMSDWFATLGKRKEEHQAIVAQRKADRQARHMQKMAQIQTKNNQKEAEQAAKKSQKSGDDMKKKLGLS